MVNDMGHIYASSANQEESMSREVRTRNARYEKAAGRMLNVLESCAELNDFAKLDAFQLEFLEQVCQLEAMHDKLFHERKRQSAS